MPKAVLTLTLTGGHFRRGAALAQAAAPVMQPAVADAAAVLRDQLKRHTPQITGHLAGGWTAGPALLQGGTTNRFVSTIYNLVPYLRRVNLTSKKNRGFVERALAGAVPAARQRVKRGTLRIAPVLWEPGKK